MVIDIHTHCFPDKLAPRAIAALSRASGNMEPYTDGTVSGLLSSMDRAGVSVSAVMNIATNPHQMRAVNDFAASIRSARIIPFGSVHPDAPDALEELERIHALGLPGVKFHPQYQNFRVDEARMRPIWKKISQLGLVTLFHAGGDIGFAEPYGSMPDALARALRDLDVPVVAAHWGGAFFSGEVLKHLCGLPLYFDTSFGYGVIPAPQARRIIERHGVERMLFGTDTPWHTPEQEMRLLSSLGLTEEETGRILGENAAKLLHLN